MPNYNWMAIPIPAASNQAAPAKKEACQSSFESAEDVFAPRHATRKFLRDPGLSPPIPMHRRECRWLHIPMTADHTKQKQNHTTPPPPQSSKILKSRPSAAHAVWGCQPHRIRILKQAGHKSRKRALPKSTSKQTKEAGQTYAAARAHVLIGKLLHECEDVFLCPIKFFQVIEIRVQRLCAKGALGSHVHIKKKTCLLGWAGETGATGVCAC